MHRSILHTTKANNTDMMNIEFFILELEKHNITFFTGVPDSYLNGFNNYLKTNVPVERNVITANEGNAIAFASGYYFATGNIPVVYMQNSGLGNCVNPLVSLADSHVYAVPMILLIGWRGEPGTKDGEREQHTMQGRISGRMLDDMEIPYKVLSEETAADDITYLVSRAKERNAPAALLVPNGVLTEKKKNDPDDSYSMSREEAIAIVMDNMPCDTIYSATTGRATRELYAQREIRGESHAFDFLNIGSMGHASSVAMGIALSKPERKVVCLDGDAAAIMHMGAMTMVCKMDIPNFVHVVLNNGAHESVGGQPSVGHMINFTGIAESCGYFTVGHPATTAKELATAVKQCLGCGRPSFIDARIHSGIRSDLQAIDMSSHEMIHLLKQKLNK